MGAYVTPPIFRDNVGQLLSAADLDILRSNVALAEAATLRPAEAFASSGPHETANTYGHYEVENDQSFIAWDGYLMIKAGMTTLTIEAVTSGVGSSIFYLNVNNVQLQNWTPGDGTWSRTQSLAAYAVGSVVRITITVKNVGLSATGSILFSDIYGSPLAFSDPWPGVPTFGSQFLAADLTQLANATAWVLNRSAVVGRAAMLLTRYGIGSIAGPDRRPLYFGTIGRYHTSHMLRLGMQLIVPPTHTNLHVEVWVGGSLAYDSGALPAGQTTNLSQWISLSGVSVGSRSRMEIWTNEQATLPRSSYAACRPIIWDLRSDFNATSIYATPAAPPAAETTITAASVATFLNSLASSVSASKARIDATPNFYGRVRAQRAPYAKYTPWEKPVMQRYVKSFWRAGDALTVHGKGVAVEYGPVNIPTNDRGLAYDDYTILKSQNVIDSDKVATQTIYLDSAQGLTRTIPYALRGEAYWAEESVL